MQPRAEDVYVNRWLGSLDEVGSAKRQIMAQTPNGGGDGSQEPPREKLRYMSDPRLRPLNIDKFLMNLSLQQKWRKMAKARVFPLAVPRHAVHVIRVLTEICEESLAKIAGLARSEAQKQQPENLHDWNVLHMELKETLERRNIVDWRSVAKILKNIEPLCYDSTKLETASQEGGAEENASVAEAYRSVRTCLWILYLRLVAVKAFLEWFIPIGRLTARDALGRAQLECFPDLMVVSVEVPILAYCQSDLVAATRALSMRWRSNLFYFSGLEKYVETLKARFVMLVSFPASAETLDRVGLYQESEGETTKRVSNMDFLFKMMDIFVPMERDIMMHQRLLVTAGTNCVQSTIWTQVHQRNFVWKSITSWMQTFTAAARGQFVAKRFRKNVMAALVRVGEAETFVRKFPNSNLNPRNIVSKLRPNDSRKYDSQFLTPALRDVIQTTLSAFVTCADENKRGGSGSQDPDVKDRETPADHISARRELFIHCLDQLFQETNQSLQFEIFLIRDLGVSPQNISDILLQSKTEARVIILQTLSGFSVWNPRSKRLTVAGNLPTAVVEWAAEIIRNERRFDPDDVGTALGGHGSTSTMNSKDLLIILRNIGLQELVLKLAGA